MNSTMITYQIVGQINKEMSCEQLEKEVVSLRMRYFLPTSFPFLILAGKAISIYSVICLSAKHDKIS